LRRRSAVNLRRRGGRAATIQLAVGGIASHDSFRSMRLKMIAILGVVLVIFSAPVATN